MPRLWLINQFSNTPDLSGHTRQYEFARDLVNVGWNVSVYASDFNLSTRRYTKLSGRTLSFTEYPSSITWHWLWASPYRRNNWRRHLNLLSFCIHCILRIFIDYFVALFVRRSPDIILASSPQLPVAFFLLLFCRLFRIKFVFEVRDLWPQVLIDQGGLSSRNPYVLILSFMESVLYRFSDHTIYLAKGVKDYLTDRGSEANTWLPNGPDLSVFTYSPPAPPSKYFTVLYAGAHGAANDLSTVVSAARLISKNRMPIRFLLVGDGAEKVSLVSSSSDLPNIIFHAPVSKESIYSFIVQADAILLTLRDVPLFRYGVSPNKLYDAYAVGRPIITNVAGHISNEINDHRLGFTALPGNATSLAKAVVDLYETPFHERLEMSLRSRELAESFYSRSKVSKRLNSLLYSLLDT